VFPFVDEDWLDDAAAALAPIAARLAPFELDLDRAGAINPRTTALFPSPATARAVADLHAAVAAPFAHLLERPDFHAHMTIARGAPARTAGTALPALDDARLRWTVDRLAILVQTDGIYEPILEIPLGPPPLATAPPLAATAPPAIEPVVAAVQASVRELAGDAATVAIDVFGSAVYAPEHAADVDLILRTGSTPPHELAQLLADAHGLALHGPPWRLRGAIAVPPGPRRRVDLLVIAGDEIDAARWLAGPVEGRMLREHLELHGREAAFLAAWPHVRAFARARALERNGLGYFGGYGWALLLAIPLCHDPTVCAAPTGRALAPWLRWAGALRPGARIGFDDIRDDDHEPLWLSPPSSPRRSAARFLSPGTAATLFAELHRAARLLGAAELDDAGALARAATDLTLDPPPGELLTIRGTGDAARGRYEGAARRLIGELEAAHGTIRVWGRFDHDTTGAWEHRISVPADRLDAARAQATALLGDPDLTVADPARQRA
ncbi:MAG: 2'-5' RNA ligase family protein, partial [Deltaproteobacteria bacterium]|nr:2'-5' RNA ligase family protein [Deltaproteobacteria bacterium]